MPAPITRDSLRLWHDPCLGGVDVLHAQIHTYAFSPHAHEEMVIAVYEQGTKRFVAGGLHEKTGAGTILVLPPDIAHHGGADDEHGCAYRAFYPGPTLLRRLLADLPGVRLPSRALTFRHPALYQDLLATHHLMTAGTPLLVRQEKLTTTLGRVLAHVGRSDPATAPAVSHAAIRKVRDYIEAHADQDVDITRLAGLVDLSPSHLMRSFRQQTGIPIHAHLTRVRLRRARQLLLAGEPAAEVAAAVGYADQSHFIRRFRATYGATPGSYVRDSRIVLSSRPLPPSGC